MSTALYTVHDKNGEHVLPTRPRPSQYMLMSEDDIQAFTVLPLEFALVVASVGIGLEVCKQIQHVANLA